MNAKAATLVDIAYSQIGSPYVFGAWGDPCTEKLRDKYISCQPTHKNDIIKGCQILNGSGKKTCTGCKYKGKNAFDCRGFTKWCLQQAGIVTLSGSGCTEQYNTEKNWMKQGLIADMPDTPCIVFQFRNGKFQHTGIYVGNGKVVHASTGVIESDLNSAWTHYAIPKSMYTVKELNAEYALMVEITKVGYIRGGDWSKSVKIRAAVIGDRYEWVATSALSGYYGFRDGKRVRWIPAKYAKLVSAKK